MDNKSFQLSTLSAAVASTLITSYALAENPALEEVMVTATRRSESVQDIPLNITALSADMIRRERISDLTDLARRVPGMNVVDQGARAADTVTVRGLNVESVSPTDGDNDGGGTVGTYLGEIPLYLDLRPIDLERIEVLIGPQGTLYGAGTLGGAVRYIPNRPEADALTMQVRGDIFTLNESSEEGYDGGFTINVPVIEDKLAVRASIDYLDDPGFIDYNFLVREPGVSNPQPDFSDPADVAANLYRKEDANDAQVTSGRFGVRYTTDDIDANLTYYYQETESGARQINHREAFGTGKYESAHRFLEPMEREQDLLALEVVADLGFAELTVAAGLSSYDEEGTRDQTDLLLALPFSYADFPAFVGYTEDTAEEDTTTFEARLVSNNDGMFNWIAGVYYNQFELESLSQEFTPNYDVFEVNRGGGTLRPDSLEYYFELDQEVTETAVFGELEFQVSDAWQVTVGARWFEYEDDAYSFLSFPLSETVFYGAPADSKPPFDVTDDKVEDDDVLLKFNTSYDVSDDKMVYFTISEGYRLGGVNQIGACPEDLGDLDGQVCGLPNELGYKSDSTTNYELGLRSQWGDSIILNASLFYIDWEDTQLDAPAVNGDQPITKNAGSATSEGLEIAGQWFTNENLTISGSYSYTKAELTDDAPCLYAGGDVYRDGNNQIVIQDCLDDPLDLGASAYDGDRLPGSPEHQAHVAANYSMELNNGSRLDFDWSTTFTGDVITKAGERASGEELDGYILHNASITLEKANYTTSFYVDNVFDEFAETGVRTDFSLIRQAGDFDLRRYYKDVVRPRQIGIRFVYNFED
jgi:iron complex outermembrane recepter protein